VNELSQESSCLWAASSLAVLDLYYFILADQFSYVALILDQLDRNRTMDSTLDMEVGK
jgi:hypothetical protein